MLSNGPMGASNSQSTGSNGGATRPMLECPLFRMLSPIKAGFTNGQF